MGKVPVELRKNIADNIRSCRCNLYPMWGGAKKCAKDFGVSPQQWSQWERGAHMPDEFRMMELATFFGVDTEYLRRDNKEKGAAAIPFADRLFQFASVGAVRIDNGIEIPLRVEVERLTYNGNCEIKMERIL